MSDVEDRRSKSSHKHKSSRHSKDKEDHARETDSSHKKRSGKHHKDSDDDDDRKHRKHKRRKEDKGGTSTSKSKSKSKSKGLDIVDDDEEDMWIEADLNAGGEHPLATDIPTAESLNIASHASELSSAPLPASVHAESKPQRDEWMLLDAARPAMASENNSSARMMASLDEGLTEEYGEPSDGKRTLGGGIDFFSSLGTERKKKPKEDKPNPDQLRVSRMELNTQFKEGKSLDEYATTPAPKPQTPGGPGSQWRMQKLKRIYETAEEEGRPIQEVALERYGSLEAFEEAIEERRILDERAERRGNRSGARADDRGRDGDRGRERREPLPERFMFNDLPDDASRASSRSSSFRKPIGYESNPSTPQGGGAATPQFQGAPATNRRVADLRGGPAGKSPGPSTPPTKPSTPIPSAFTPTNSGKKRALSPSSLNKLQAQVLRAKLMGQANADELEKRYDEELAYSQSGGADENGVRVEMVPTMDSRGRLYDIGAGRSTDGPSKPLPGNRKKKEVVETRDSKTGEMVRYNADDDSTTLGDMLRQERFGAGMADQKDMDAELAKAIMTDGKFQNDLEYMDDNAEKLGRKKMRTDAMKRQFAINDYARTQKAMASCQFCYGEDDSAPKAGMIALGTRVYLACTLFEELVEGHCLIVPIQHYLNMLEADDDVWEEVRNFMKCLMKMFYDQNKGVIFYETVVSLKPQKHTAIECVPVSLDLFEDLPAYFKESILASEAEWSQHKKLIDFSSRPGGFRRAMVPNLPYFMVQWDYKGEKGYGHVIEGTGESAGLGDEPEGAVDEGDKGGGEFPRYFAAEIVGNQLDLEPRKWRRPRKIDLSRNKDRVAKFKAMYSKYDWTPLIPRS